MKTKITFLTVAAFFCGLIVSANTAIASKEFMLNVCEYSVVFPDGYSTKKSNIAGIEQLIAEYKGVPYFRAECLAVSDRPIIHTNLMNAMCNMVKLAGFPFPQTTIEETNVGTVGTYMAFKNVDGHDMKIFGKCYLGQKSLFHVVVIEGLLAFPSHKTIQFLDSIRKFR